MRELDRVLSQVTALTAGRLSGARKVAFFIILAKKLADLPGQLLPGSVQDNASGQNRFCRFQELPGLDRVVRALQNLVRAFDRPLVPIRAQHVDSSVTKRE